MLATGNHCLSQLLLHETSLVLFVLVLLQTQTVALNLFPITAGWIPVPS